MQMDIMISKLPLCVITVLGLLLGTSGCKDNLHTAVDKGDLKKVKKLVNAGSNVNRVPHKNLYRTRG